MFDPLAFASSSALEVGSAETCGCGCTGVVGVRVDDWVIVAY